ncbi:MAG: hypothetical protein U0996_10275 [Planctomycetaceae bacterium]
MTKRDELVQQLRQRFNDTGARFNERERRHWAAAEALRLGRGGITVVSQALRISPNTIKKGIAELTSANVNADSAEVQRIRRAGGGRKPRRDIGNAPDAH